MQSIVSSVVKRSRLTVFLLVLVIVAGVSVYFSQARQEDPEITLRKAQVVARFPGLPSEQVEQLLIKPIEEAIKTIPEVESIESTALNGMAIVLPEVEDKYFDLAPIWTKLRTKMDELEPRLPKGTTSLSVNDEFGRVSVITLALRGKDFSPRELRWTARNVRDTLATLPLVATVDLYGVQEERVWLEMDPEQLNRLGIEPSLVVTELQKQNVVLPGGSVVATGMRLRIQPSGDFSSLEDIRRVPIAVSEGQGTVYLQDLVQVRRGYQEPPPSLAFYNGDPSVILGISMISGANIAELGQQVEALLPELRAELPLGMELDVFNYQPELVAIAVAGATENLWQTVLVVLAVVMLFLGWRTGLIVGAGIPLTIMLVLVGMSLWGIALHRISIAAVIVALGLLVDNGIVVAEDIQRRLGLGQDRMNAAEESSASLAMPLLVSSLTTILAFLPLMLAENTSGEFLASLTQVVILALIASWFLAVSVTPAFCYWFLPVKQGSDNEARPSGGVYTIYEKVLGFAVRYRYVVVAVSALAVLGSLSLMGQVKQRNMPPSERNQFTASLSLQAGSDISETIIAARKFADFLSDAERNPEVTGNAAYVATGGPRFFLALQPPDPLAHTAFFVVNVEAYEQLPEVMARAEDYMASQLPGVRGRTDTLFLGASPIGTVETRLTGPDIPMLQVLSEKVLAAYRKVPGITGLRSDWENPVLALRLQIDQDKAARAGLSSQDIARSLSGILDGYQVSDFRQGETVIPIIIRSGDERRTNLDRLRSLEVFSSALGKPVPITQVATLEGVVEPSQIRRLDQRRTVTIAARHPNMGAAELYRELAPHLENIDLPLGYNLGPAGELADAAESQGELFKYAPHCLLGILALLIFQFNSWRKSLLVMATIPLVLVGAIPGLYLLDAHFEFPALLGLFSLAGIIINNSIVLIDRITQEIENGVNIREATVSAALIRARPILMTTTTTVVGLIPLALLGGQFWFSMSIVIMGGLAAGSVLTMLFTPAAYVIVFRNDA